MFPISWRTLLQGFCRRLSLCVGNCRSWGHLPWQACSAVQGVAEGCPQNRSSVHCCQHNIRDSNPGDEKLPFEIRLYYHFYRQRLLLFHNNSTILFICNVFFISVYVSMLLILLFNTKLLYLRQSPNVSK